MPRRLVLALLAVLVATGATACGEAARAKGDAHVALDRGDVAHAAAPGKPFEEVENGQRLDDGTRIRAVRGTPAIELVRGGTVTLRQGASLILGRPLLLERGQVLMDTDDELTLDTVVAAVSAKGVTRVGQSLATSVRVYEGTAEVSSLGRSLSVPARRQVAVPAKGLVPQEAAPTTWRRSDPWDARYLGLVIDLTDQLDAQGRGFALQARSASARDIAPLFPGLSAGEFARVASDRSSGDALVGGGISAAGKRAPNRVFGLRDDGAAWGLVAVEAVEGDPAKAVSLVRAAIAAWLARAGVVGADPRLVATPPSTPAVTTPPSSSSGGSPSTTTPPNSGSTTTTPPTTTPTTPTTAPLVTIPPPVVTVPPVPTTVPLLDEVVGGIADAAGGLLGGG